MIEEESSYKPNYVQTESELNTKDDPICSSAGCTQYLHKTTPLGYPIDYAVPHFGRDNDINDNADDLAVAEKAHNHEWKWVEEKPSKPVIYKDNNPLDPDVRDSL